MWGWDGDDTALMGDVGLVGCEDEECGDRGSNHVPEMRERACSFERRIGSIDACQSSKLDFPRRVGILRWVAWDNSGAMAEGIVDAGRVEASSGPVR